MLEKIVEMFPDEKVLKADGFDDCISDMSSKKTSD